MNELFAVLRRILNGTPDPARWRELLQALERWPDAASFDLALEYAVSHLSSWPEEICVLAVENLNSPLLPLAKGLRWGAGLDGPAVGQCLSEARELTWLRSLNLYHRRLGNRGVQFVSLYSPHLRDLRSLELRYNEIDARGVGVLARSRYLTGLDCLDLSGNPIGCEGVERLCRSGFSFQLKILRLQDCSVGAEGLRCLAETRFPNLEQLSLANGGFRQEDLSILAHVGGRWPRLQRLDLRHCQVNEEWRARIEGGSWPEGFQGCRW